MLHVPRYLIPPIVLALAIIVSSGSLVQSEERKITPHPPRGGWQSHNRDWQQIDYEAPEPPPPQPDQVLIPPGNSVAYDPLRDVLYLVGAGETGHLEAWKIQLGDEITELQFVPALNPPPPAALEEVIYDPVDNRLIVFGLENNDNWELTLNEPAAWRPLPIFGELPRPRKDFSVVYDEQSHRLLLYGGLYLHFYNDTWELPLDGELHWRKLTPPFLDRLPLVKRFDHRAIYDATRNRMIVYGGQIEPHPEYDRPYCRDDAWQLIPDIIPLWKRFSTGGIAPTRRRDPIVVHDTNRDRMIVMGGKCYTDVWSDAFALDLATSQWSPFRSIPSHLRDLLWDAVYDPVRDRILAHAGGSNFWQLKADGSSEWEILPTPVRPPPIPVASARAFGTMIHDPVRDRFLVFGGEGSVPGDLDALHDVFAFEFGDQATATAVEASHGPAARYYHATIYEPVRNEMIVYGGNDYPTIFTDLWALSLAETPVWRWIEPVGDTPPPQREPIMVYDSRRTRLLLLAAGQDPQLTEVWFLDLLEEPRWQRYETSGASPPTRRFASAAYDPENDRLVVTGGWDERLSSSLDDIWTLDFHPQGRAKWSRVKIPPNEPRPYGGTAHAYDPVKNRLVLSGAWDEHGVRQDQVWSLSLDGKPEWKLLHPGGSEPGLRLGEQLAVDPVRNRLLAFGGRTSSPFAYWDDLWQLPLPGPRRGPDGAPIARESPTATLRVDERNKVKAEFGLAILSPNPARNHLRIRFSLPAPGDAVLDIFDVRGQVVEHRLMNSIPPGSHEIEFRDLESFPSGVYFLRLSQRGEEFIERFVLLR